MPSTSQINNNQMDQQMNTNPSMVSIGVVRIFDLLKNVNTHKKLIKGRVE